MGRRQTPPTTGPQSKPRAPGWREMLSSALAGHFALDHSLERYFDYLERAQ